MRMKPTLLVITILFSLTVNANAYFDPGSASVIISAITAFFVSILSCWRIVIQKIKNFFSQKNKNDAKD